MVPVGDAVTVVPVEELRVAEGVHEQVEAPLPVKATLEPVQITVAVAGVTDTIGNWFTVTVFVIVFLKSQLMNPNHFTEKELDKNHLMAHWIDDDWIMHNIILDFVNISEMTHTGANLVKMLEQVIDDLLPDDNRIIGVVCDNASNNDTLFENLQNHHRQSKSGRVLKLLV